MSNGFRSINAAVFVVLVMAGCGRESPPPAMAPPAVTVAHPIQREVIEWDEFTGRLEAVETVEVRARVSGFIEKADFTEGTIVKAGDLLFQIDARQYNAELAKAQADVSKAQAQLAYSTNEFKRLENLRSNGGSSELEVENARQKMLEAAANVEGAKALVQAAQLNVDWTRVTAPIDGRISRKFVTPGNLINGGPGQATLLTTIASIDPIYCITDGNEQALLKYQRLAAEGRRVSARDAPIPAFLQLGDEKSFPHEGKMNFVDNRLDPDTGTIRARAVFPNADGFLKPGMFARIRIPGSGRYNALLVPDAAIGTDQNLRFVMVVKSDDTVEQRTVKLGALFGDLRAVESGLSVEDRVVINGLQRARPGAKVSPKTQEIPGDALVMTAPGSPTTQSLPATAPAGGAR
jgi:RND family efflux transporter MFP subunit